jgi:hypothetical protein
VTGHTHDQRGHDALHRQIGILIRKSLLLRNSEQRRREGPAAGPGRHRIAEAKVVCSADTLGPLHTPKNGRKRFSRSQVSGSLSDAGLGAPRTWPVQSWWVRARARSLCGMSVPGVAPMHAARERCMHACPVHALHAHRGRSPCARRRAGHGSWWTRIGFDRRCRVAGSTLWVAYRLAATALM